MDVIDYFRAWLTWRKVKNFAELTHPGWLYFATKAGSRHLRDTYRKKILDAYNMR